MASNQVLAALGRILQGAAARITVRSAMNPMLHLVAIGFPLCLIGAIVFRNNPLLESAFGWSAIGLLALAALSYVGWAFLKPQMLQSEDFQLRQQSLTLIETKGGAIAIDPASLQSIANPALHALPPAAPEVTESEVGQEEDSE